MTSKLKRLLEKLKIHRVDNSNIYLLATSIYDPDENDTADIIELIQFTKDSPYILRVQEYQRSGEDKISYFTFSNEDSITSFIIKDELLDAVIDGYITESEVDEAKNINFEINKEDYGLFLNQIKEFIPIKNIKTVSYLQFEGTEYDGAYKVTCNDENVRIFGWKDFIRGLNEFKIED